MKTPDESNHLVDGVRDFFKSRTPIELIALGAIALLVIDLLLVPIRATTLMLVVVATLPWWLPCLRDYLWAGAPLAEPEPEPMESDENPPPETPFDDTDQYGA